MNISNELISQIQQVALFLLFLCVSVLYIAWRERKRERSTPEIKDRFHGDEVDEQAKAITDAIRILGDKRFTTVQRAINCKAFLESRTRTLQPIDHSCEGCLFDKGEGKRSGECNRFLKYKATRCQYYVKPKEGMKMNLPAVAGRMIAGSLLDLENRAKLYLKTEQEKIAPDNGLVAVLCDTVRLCREYADHAEGRMK